MQLLLQTDLTSAEYVSQQGWRQANLPRCPLHTGGGCGFKRHTAYVRKIPEGTRVARWYCPLGRVTFSLLPSFLASRLPGTLAEVEHAAGAAEGAATLAEATRSLRPDLADERSARRWLRRRVRAVRAALLALVTLVVELAGVPATLRDVRQALGTVSVLGEVRQRLGDQLPSLPAPVGFQARSPARSKRGVVQQHTMGPDPPYGGK